MSRALEVRCRVCQAPAIAGAYCFRHGPETVDLCPTIFAPAVTAGDVLAALAPVAEGLVGPWPSAVLVDLHGFPVAIILDGSDLRVYRNGAALWSGRLVAYPAAYRVDRLEGGKVYPCPRCGGAVGASLGQAEPRADCPDCGAALRLEVRSAKDFAGGPAVDCNQWKAA